MTRIVYLILLVIVTVVSSYGQEPLVENYRFGSFVHAHAIDTDPFGNIYVSDEGDNKVYKFDIKGTEHASIGGQGWGQEQFDAPMGLDASLGVSVYVADYNNNRIIRLDKDLHFIGSFSTQDASGTQYPFGYPRDIAVSPVGNMYILDDENQHIAYSSGFATIESVFGGTEAGIYRLEAPVALAPSQDNTVYVLESKRVVCFDVFGNPVTSFGEKMFTDATGIDVFAGFLAVVCPSSVHFFHKDGTYSGAFTAKDFVFASSPGEFRDIAITRDHLLLLTEQYVILLPNPFMK